MDLPDIVTADESNFDFQVLAHSEYVPVLVFFWAPWNLVCLKLDPYLEKLVEGYGGRFRLARVNVDENPQLSRKYQVRTVPTIKSFQEGRVSHQSEGINTEGGVLAFVRTVIPGPENLSDRKSPPTPEVWRLRRGRTGLPGSHRRIPDPPPGQSAAGQVFDLAGGIPGCPAPPEPFPSQPGISTV